MRILYIFLTTLCLFVAETPVYGAPNQEIQKIEIIIGDGNSQLMGIQFLVGDRYILQIHVDPQQSELFTPKTYSTLPNKDLEQTILQNWEHTTAEGIHILRFDLPKGIFIMNVLGRNKSQWPNNTYINKNGEIKSASYEGSYTFAVSNKETVSVLPGDSYKPKRPVTIRKYLIISDDCFSNLKNLTKAQ